jgi:glycerol-3-phosphate responsive antiterminator
VQGIPAIAEEISSSQEALCSNCRTVKILRTKLIPLAESVSEKKKKEKKKKTF